MPEPLAQQIGTALAGDGDAVVELARDEVWSARYRRLDRLRFLPEDAGAPLGVLPMFERSAALVDSVAVFDRVAIVADSMLLRDGTGIDSPRYIPGYLGPIYAAHPTYQAAIAGHQSAPSVEIDQPVFVPLHPWCRIYGHFLMEALPRFAVVRQLYRLGLRYPLYVDGEAPRFIRDYLALALPEVPLLHGRRGVTFRARKVIAPSLDPPLMRLSVARLDFVEGLVESCFTGEAPRRAPWRKLFILRPRQPGHSYRFLANQDRLAAVAAEYGYRPVAPEQLSVAEQVRVFGEARAIAGEYSSALHNALLAPAGTAVISFNWVNHYQLSIALARGHSLEVIAPERGGFIDAHTPPAVTYTIAERTFREALERCEAVR